MFNKILLDTKKSDLMDFRIEVEKFNLILASSNKRLRDEMEILSDISIPIDSIEQQLSQIQFMQEFNTVTLKNLKNFNFTFILGLSENCTTDYLYYRSDPKCRKIILCSNKLLSKIIKPIDIKLLRIYLGNLIDTRILYTLLDHTQFIESLDEKYAEYLRELCSVINQYRNAK